MKNIFMGLLVTINGAVITLMCALTWASFVTNEVAYGCLLTVVTLVMMYKTGSEYSFDE